MTRQTGELFLVATPIGHLGDITLHALEVLKIVDLIAAEDTRHSKRLLQHYSINTPLLSLHEHNEQQRLQQLLSRLSQGQRIALISDAGTPLISDPGYRLVHAALAENIKVTPIPGACAAIAALIASGLPTDRFVFEGFLSSKKNLRQTQLESLKQETRTIILYESVHRVMETLEVIAKVFGVTQEVAVARELTKAFESIHVGPIADVIHLLQEKPTTIKGEFVILIKGTDKDAMGPDEKASHRVLEILLGELPLKQAVSLSTKITGISRKILYAMALSMKPKDG